MALAPRVDHRPAPPLPAGDDQVPRPPAPPPRWRRLVLPAALAAVAAIAWLALRSWPAAEADVFRTAPVARGELAVTVSATGTIEPEEVVDVGAQVVGMIREFGRDPADPRKPVDYGSTVDVGTVLAQIDDTLYRAQLDQARANAQRARADLLDAQAKLRAREASKRVA